MKGKSMAENESPDRTLQRPREMVKRIIRLEGMTDFT